MAGGDYEAFEKVKGIFETMGTTIVYTGPSGTGMN